VLCVWPILVIRVLKAVESIVPSIVPIVFIEVEPYICCSIRLGLINLISTLWFPLFSFFLNLMGGLIYERVFWGFFWMHSQPYFFFNYILFWGWTDLLMDWLFVQHIFENFEGAIIFFSFKLFCNVTLKEDPKGKYKEGRNASSLKLTAEVMHAPFSP
jgi:hypothetical protein